MVYANPTNVSSITGMFTYTNSVTNNLFAPAILFVIWIILFITLKQWRTEGALTSSTFIVMLLTFILRAGNIVGDVVVAIVTILFLLTIFIQIMDREKTPY